MVDYYVTKINTFKSGNFIFSRKYSERRMQPLIIEARILYETVQDLPILPELASSLRQDLIRKSIFGTAAIEGNPISEEKVAEIISDTSYELTTERAELEIKNLGRAYNIVEHIHQNDSPPLLKEKVIKSVHKAITKDVQHRYNNPGEYRNYKVQVGDNQHGGIYTPPKCLPDIKKLMKAFLEWINSKEVLGLEEIVRAALSHYYIALIHPFGDGNGRTARLIEAALLQWSGIKYVPVMLSNYYYRNMDDYFIAFSNTIKNKRNHELTPFVEFVLRGAIESLKEIKIEITHYIRKFVLRDYYEFLKNRKKITQRQLELLLNLLDYGPPVSLKDLYEEFPFRTLYKNVSERTARRDLKKLSKLLLRKTDDNRYSLNWKVLEEQ